MQSFFFSVARVEFSRCLLRTTEESPKGGGKLAKLPKNSSGKYNCGKNTLVKQRHTLEEKKKGSEKSDFSLKFLLRSLSLSVLFFFSVRDNLARECVSVKAVRLELSALFTNTSAPSLASEVLLLLVYTSSVRVCCDCMRSRCSNREKGIRRNHCALFFGKKENVVLF